MTTTEDNSTAVRAHVRVSAVPARAFAVFTDGIDTWWNRDHHLLPDDVHVAVEPFVGGRVHERNQAGNTCVWGQVLTWDPPHVFAFSWRIGPSWGIPAAGDPASRVTVTFTPDGTGTGVELVHDRLDVHGDGWHGARDSLGGNDGWQGNLQWFVAVADAVRPNG